MRSLLLGGLLPVLLFTVVEDRYGTLVGLVVGMIYGVCEIIFEKWKYKKVERMTWFGNGLLLFFGGISLLTADGVWFKLQPAIIELAMAGFLFGSWIMKKPFLWTMANSQGAFVDFPVEGQKAIEKGFSGITMRLSVFFLMHAVLATHAAFYWSSKAWMLLKGVGFTVSMLVYLFLEVILLRKSLQSS